MSSGPGLEPVKGDRQEDDLRYLLTLVDGRQVYAEPGDILRIPSQSVSAEYKRTFDHYVEPYERQGLTTRLRDSFHRIQAHLYRPNRGRLAGFLAYLATPVPPVRKFGRFLDVGCNTANLLSKLPDPWERYGVEVNARAVQAASRRGNVHVTQGVLEEVPLEPRYDFIRVSHVIEHVQDYQAFLKQLFLLLNEGGHVLIYTPNTDSISFRIFRRYWGPLYDPTHVTLFNLANLEEACLQAGFEIVSDGSYYMGITGDSLLRFLRLPNKRVVFGAASYLLLLALYPFSFVVNRFRRGGALYLYLRKPPVPSPQEVS